MKVHKLVATITVWIYNSKKGSHPSWIHCYENGYGDRSFKYVSGYVYFPEHAVDDIQTFVHPWMLKQRSNKQLLAVAKQSATKPAS